LGRSATEKKEDVERSSSGLVSTMSVLHQGTEEGHEKYQTGLLVYRLGLEPGSSTMTHYGWW